MFLLTSYVHQTHKPSQNNFWCVNTNEPELRSAERRKHNDRNQRWNSWKHTPSFSALPVGKSHATQFPLPTLKALLLASSILVQNTPKQLGYATIMICRPHTKHTHKLLRFGDYEKSTRFVCVKTVNAMMQQCVW